MAIKKRLLRLSIGALIASGRVLGARRGLRLAHAIARRVSLDPRFDRERTCSNIARFFPGAEAEWIEATSRALATNTIRAKVFDKHFVPRLDRADLDEIVEMVGIEHLEGVLASGRGAVCVSLHYGRYWVAPVWLSSRGYSPAAFQKADGKLPFEAETLSGGSFSANDPLASVRAVKALKQGAFTFLILDAGRIPNPVAVDFLGQPTLFSPSAIRMARAAKAAIIPALAHIDPDDPDRVRVVFSEPIETSDIGADPSSIEATLRRMVAPFEDAVRAHPEQWYGLQSAHRRLATPEGEEARAELAHVSQSNR